MKKTKYLLFTAGAFAIGMMNTFAATASLSAAKQIEVGQSVKATVSVNAAAWDIKINGTGNTNGCSTHDANASESGSNIKKSISVSCTANSTGVIKINYSGDITDANGATKDVSGSTIITVVAARPKSSNNYLKGLSLEGVAITPEFSKDNLEYNAVVEAGTEKVVIKADKEDGYASVTGAGEQAVVEGDNRFEIKVTSESGAVRTYVLTVTVKEFAPIVVKVDGKEFTVVRKLEELTKPESFTESSITIGEDTVPAFVNEKLGLTLVGLKNEEGKIFLYSYNDGKYSRYYEFTSTNLTLNIIDMDRKLLPSGYKKYTATINEEEIEVYKLNKKSNFALVYAIDVNTGKKDLYQVDLKNNTFQLFNKDTQEKIDNTNKDTMLIAIVGGSVILLEFLVILSSRRKNKKILNKIKDSKMNKVKNEAIKESKNEKIKEEKEDK